MDREELERRITWSALYAPTWDTDPDAYVSAGLVGWGRSRRLGRLAVSPGFLAYLGVQHVDPLRAGWRGFDAPEARFFVSWFDGRRCLGLRTVPTVAAARDLLWAAWKDHARRHGLG